MIVFNKCNITIHNETFENKTKEIYKEKYLYPNGAKLKTINLLMTFDNIIANHFKNNEQIKELTFYRNISYGISLSLISSNNNCNDNIILYNIKRNNRVEIT